MNWFKKLLRRLFRKPEKLSVLERIGVEAVRRRHRGEDVRDVLVHPYVWFHAVVSHSLDESKPSFGMHTAGGTVRVIKDWDCPIDSFQFVSIGAGS